MTTAATSTLPAGSPRPSRPHRAGRRALLLLHLATSMGWLGVTAAFVVLTAWLSASSDPAALRTGYGIHELLVVWLARPAAIGATVTGLLLAVTARPTHPRTWRRRWWLPAKLALVVATVVVTVNVSPDALRSAVDGAEAVGTTGYAEVQQTLVLMAIYHVVMISAAAVLAVHKPVRRSR